MGQGVLLLSERGAAANPFFLLVPGWGQMPMVVLATLATVIASQAVISGAFSVTRQAVRLGFLPFLTIRHTSEKAVGQVYVAAVNWSLFVAIVGLVIGFGSSTALASAYGIAVTGTLAIDTVLFFVVVRMLWRKPLWLVLAGAAGFLFVDLSFFAANLPKVASGGWFPLVIGAVLFVVLMTWRRGRDIVTRHRIEMEGPLQKFVSELDASARPARPGARHCGVPARERSHDAAGPALQRQAQPRPARAHGDLLRRDGGRPARRRGRAHRHSTTCSSPMTRCA